MKLAVVDINNKKLSDVTLNKDVFGVDVRKDILQRVVSWQLAKKRSGNHQTKEIGDVSGTTKKPFRQKGTGNARQGSLRSPHMRGGAVIFGPHKRDHSYDLPKKVRKLGMKSALSAKMAENHLIILDDIKLESNKTKELKKILEKNGWNSALVITGSEVDAKLGQAASNIPNLDVLPQQGANVYSILKREKLILTKDAVHHLEARLSS
jgi:large subunit ribosomal protein L4